MWQTILILLLLAGALAYVVRHYVRASRSATPSCSGCSGCCGAKPQEREDGVRCE